MQRKFTFCDCWIDESEQKLFNYLIFSHIEMIVVVFVVVDAHWVPLSVSNRTAVWLIFITNFRSMEDTRTNVKLHNFNSIVSKYIAFNYGRGQSQIPFRFSSRRFFFLLFFWLVVFDTHAFYSIKLSFICRSVHLLLNRRQNFNSSSEWIAANTHKKKQRKEKKQTQRKERIILSTFFYFSFLFDFLWPIALTVFCGLYDDTHFNECNLIV